jgi:soluble lytic murein transglycosylase-like protein
MSPRSRITRFRKAGAAPNRSRLAVVYTIVAIVSLSLPADSQTFLPAGAHKSDAEAAVLEASGRFKLPAGWIRSVITAESGWNERVISAAGAMGLMQIMPATWNDMRLRYRLGANPFLPHDNIIAGSAYLRAMLERYGTNGFLAAYNAGPERYENHLATGRPLPRETQAYINSVTAAARLPIVHAGDDVQMSTESWTGSALFVRIANANAPTGGGQSERGLAVTTKPPQALFVPLSSDARTP